MSNDICHNGIVQEIGETEIIVKILSQSACAACHAKSMCNISEMKEKIIEVKKEAHYDFKPGDEVRVIMTQGKGFRALFLGYILPFLILMAALIIVLSITNDEGLAGLVSIGLIIPYYIVLWLRKDKIKERFEFRLEKIASSN